MGADNKKWKVCEKHRATLRRYNHPLGKEAFLKEGAYKPQTSEGHGNKESEE